MKDELEPLADDLEALLDAERAAPPAPTRARERVRTRLYASLGLLGAGTASAAALSSTPKLLWKALLTKITVGLIAAVSVGAVVRAVLTSGPTPAQGSSLAGAEPGPPPEPAAPILPPPAVTSVTSPEPARPTAAERRRVRAATPREAGADGDLAGERALLEEGRAALGRGDAQTALGLLARHAGSFPRGQLIEERESLRIRALASAGRTDEARTRAAAFRARFPRSIFLPAVEATFQ